MKTLFSILQSSQTHYPFKQDFQKVDQHTGGKWLIHSTKQHNDNQLQSLELPSNIFSLRTKAWNKRVRR